MLDQNTDRMWYVIGAVLIGAAIIFGMNTLMPNAFASVSDMMLDTIESVNIIQYERSLEPVTYTPNLYFPENSGRDTVGRLSSGSDYIRVRPSDIITFSVTTAEDVSVENNMRIIYYNSKKEFVDGNLFLSTKTKEFTIPRGVQYIRVSSYNHEVSGNPLHSSVTDWSLILQ